MMFVSLVGRAEPQARARDEVGCLASVFWCDSIQDQQAMVCGGCVIQFGSSSGRNQAVDGRRSALSSILYR